MERLYLTLLIFCFSTSAFAQKAPVDFWGTIVDAFTRQAIRGEVTCSLLRPDSTVIMATKSYEHIDQGNGMPRTMFRFQVPEQPDGHVLVKLEAKGYATVYKSVRLGWKSKPTETSLWGVPMRRTSQKDGVQLGEATVKATRIKFYTKGDTLVYNADAFQLQEGSMLDALVAQLPGAELKPDGRILVNGKFVESLLLNGRDFFKGDNTVLLDNLPAYMVQQVQVYAKESETSKLLGRKVDEGQFVMDVKLKRQYSVGWLANTEWGYGTAERYLGRLFAMRYTPQSRLTLFGSLNNVNDRRKPDGNGGWSHFDASGGLTATKRGGVDYSVFDKRDRFQLWGDADISYTDNDQAGIGTSTDFLPGGDAYNVTSSRSNSGSFSVSTQHELKFNFPQSHHAFSLSPTFSYRKSDYNSNYLNGTFGVQPADDYAAVLDSLFSPDWTTTVRNLIRRNGEQAMGNSRHTNGGLSFWSFFKMPYSQDGVSVEGGISYSDRRQNGFNHFLYNYYDAADALQTDRRNRYDESPQTDFGAQVRVKYFWHWGKEIMLNPSYTLDYKREEGNRMHYRLDVLDEGADQSLGWLPSEAESLLQALDADNSYEGLLRRYRHDLTLDWQWQHYSQTPQGRRTAGWQVQFKPSVLVEDNRFRFTDFARPQADAVERSVQYIDKTYALPRLYFSMKRNTPEFRHELNFTANVRTSSPSMTNLVDKTFAADPLHVTLGNPDLGRRTDVDLSFNYKSDRWLQHKERQLYGNAGWRYTADAISMSYVYDKATGVTTSRPVNVDGNWNAWLNLGYTTPLDRQRRLTLSTTTSASFYHTVDFSGSQAGALPVRTTTRQTGVDEDLRLNYRYKKVNVGATANVSYGHATASRADFADTDTWSVRYGANAVIDLPWAFQLSTELTMFTRRGYGYGTMDRNDLVWNARLSKSVLRKRLTFMLDAWDILGNLSDINAGINSRSRWEYRNIAIPRYAMLRLVYRFDAQPKK